MIPLLMLTACASINTTEAEVVFDSLFQPLSDIRDSVLEAEVNDLALSTSLSQGSNWEGLLQAEGKREIYPLQTEYTVQLIFEEVYVTAGDLYFNGNVESLIVYRLEETDGQSYTVETTLNGDISVSGDVSGTAALDFSFLKEYTYDTDTIRIEAQGKISGTDVSSFTQGNTE